VEVLIRNDDAFEFDETFTGQLIRVTDTTEQPLTEEDGLVLDTVDTEVTIEDNDGKDWKWRVGYPMVNHLL
jgi:hypothetical protein